MCRRRGVEGRDALARRNETSKLGADAGLEFGDDFLALRFQTERLSKRPHGAGEVERNLDSRREFPEPGTAGLDPEMFDDEVGACSGDDFDVGPSSAGTRSGSLPSWSSCAACHGHSPLSSPE